MAKTHIFIKNLLLLILIFVHLSQSQTISACFKDITWIGSEKNMANILDIIPGSSVVLICRFCSQRQTYQQISWSYRKRGSNKTMPVSKKGFSTTPNYDLFFDNFTFDDSGVFTCKTPNLSDDDGINTFVLDGIEKDSDDRVGNWEQWLNYKNAILNPINRILTELTKELMIEFSFRLFTAWNNLEACERSGNNQAKRTKRGKCRLHILDRQHINIKNAHFSNNTLQYLRELFLYDNYDVSCYSLTLRFYLPKISDVVRYLPEFIVTESCDIVTNNEGTKLLERMDADDKPILKEVTEQDNITLTCPKATLQSKVEWFKDNNLINSSYSKTSLLTMDSDVLYISHVSKPQEGLYACSVNGRKAQKYDLKVLRQSASLNDDFFRYTIYLGFILSLTITCYCTGVCVAWHRKTSFADPLNVNNKNNN